VNQFEFDQLTVLAGAWEISAGTKEDAGERKAYKRCASELRDLLRHADTSPGGEPDGEPYPLPPMRAPRVPVILEDT
jgi:hypothetical protein